MSLGSNGVDRVLYLRKIPMGLRAMNFCTSSFPFCAEFCKATKQSQMHPNSKKQTKNEFRVQWDESGAFVAKSSNASSGHELSHQFCTFSIKFCEPTKQSQLH